MSEIILHHYPLSLFAEKVRRILAHKRIPWRSVEQPMMAPKPELVPLTGGNRRIPVMQIGADVYCDTACIVRRLEELQPEPPCIPSDDESLAGILEDWADHRFAFQMVPSMIVEMLPALPPGILQDRAQMSPALSREAIVQNAPHAWSQALLSLDQLEGHLGGRPFLLGDHFSIADAACFHPMWFVKQSPKLFAAVEVRPALAAWYRRIEAFGAGDVRPMAPAEALAIARETSPADVRGADAPIGDGPMVGDAVAIVADDYGVERTEGTIVRLAPDEITVLRDDPALGEIAVHFPRSGYRIAKKHPRCATEEI